MIILFLQILFTTTLIHIKKKMLFYKHLLSSMHTIYYCCYGHNCQNCCYCCYCIDYRCYCYCCIDCCYYYCCCCIDCYCYCYCYCYCCYCYCCCCIDYCCYCCYCCYYYCCIDYCCYCYCCTYYFVPFDRSPLIVAHLFLLKKQSLYSTYYKQRHYFYSFLLIFSTVF